MNDLQKLMETWYKDCDIECGPTYPMAVTYSGLERLVRLAIQYAAEEAAKVCLETNKNAYDAPHKEHENTYPDGWMDGCNECESAIHERFKS